MLTCYADELVLHCAVAGLEREETVGLVKHLIKSCPWSLEARDASSNTPLLTAAYFGRTQFMELLIAGGADESARNSHGETVVHRLVSDVDEAGKLKEALDLLDSDLRAYLFKQRSNLGHGGMTPLHRLVQDFGSHTSDDTYKCEEIVDLVLEYSKGVEVEMLNAAGDSVLHTAVTSASTWLTRLLVNFRPKLLYRENAVGRTPAELAYHEYISGVFVSPHNTVPMATCRNPEDWVRSIRQEALPTRPNKYAASSDKVWEICRTEMARYPSTRRLVSLHEANDVAKRLGEEYASARYFSTGPRADDDDEKSDEETERDVIDVVEVWMTNHFQWTWRDSDWSEKEDQEREAKLGEPCRECGHRHPVGDEDDEVTEFPCTSDGDGSDGSDSSADETSD